MPGSDNHLCWTGAALHSHQEELNDGAKLDIQVQLSRTGDTLLFVGVYERSGLARTEEGYAKCSVESMT
ncbi:hypothetical protein PPUJ13061_30640 [Pseudomonas putida]|nr:hypothetical protein [Pseudomonas putida]GLO03166.1 hypothetical protein PPUJ13061_30640 [Pseudomonas putida]